MVDAFIDSGELIEHVLECSVHKAMVVPVTVPDSFCEGD